MGRAATEELELERRRKCSDAMRGENNPSKRPEVRAKLSAAGRRSKPKSAETRAKISAATCGDKNHNWCGSEIKYSAGRVFVWLPHRGRVPRSRLVMEEHLGLILPRCLHVHHINEIKDDDRLENLALMFNREHVRWHGWNGKNKGG